MRMCLIGSSMADGHIFCYFIYPHVFQETIVFIYKGFKNVLVHRELKSRFIGEQDGSKQTPGAMS